MDYHSDDEYDFEEEQRHKKSEQIKHLKLHEYLA